MPPTHKYVNDKGENILVVSSSVPGFTMVPSGMKPSDAIPVTIKEHKSMMDKAKKQVLAPIYAGDSDLEARVAALEKQVAALSQGTNIPGTPHNPGSKNAI